MKKTIGIVLILLVMLVTLTGCVSVNYEVKVNRNGSGDISYVYAFSQDTLKSFNISAEDMVQVMKEQAQENGYKVEPYETEELAGFKASKHLKNLNKEFSLQEAFGDEYIKDNENNTIKIEKSLFTTKYSQNAEIDLTSIQEMASEVQMQYKITLPAKAKTNNASEVEKLGKTLTWNLEGGKVNKVEFTAIQINILPIIIILAAVIIVATVFIILKRKKVTKK